MTNSYPPFLRQVVRDAMVEHGFRIDFSPAAQTESASATEPSMTAAELKDLSGWLWSSIDNDDSRDLDQIEFVRREPGGIRVFVGIADVEIFVRRGSALDADAAKNTTSVYTGIQTFPMLPERLSTGLSSLNEKGKRRAIVIEYLVKPGGEVAEPSVYEAVVFNQAQLTYTAVARWLDEKTAQTTQPPAPPSEITQNILNKIQANHGLQDQLLLQHEAAEALRRRRHEAGALTLQTTEFRPAFRDDGGLDLHLQAPNSATRLIEDFMIAANQTTDVFLEQKRSPIVQRVVRVPKRWERIVQLAALTGTTLPATPDAKALEAFLSERHQNDPEHFPDLSLSVIKLLGRGEYVVTEPGQASPGHFGLAVQNYSHSTAPNRRYPDLLTQRLIKAALQSTALPYSLTELQALTQHCTTQEDEANKVERLARKCIAALALSHSIGKEFEGFITGAGEKGTWVRLKMPPVEGRLEGKTKGLDVGDRVTVRLILADPRRGYIDFETIKRL